MKSDERVFTGFLLLACWLVWCAVVRWGVTTPPPPPRFMIGVDFGGNAAYSVTEQSKNATGGIVTLSTWHHASLQFDRASKTFDTHGLNDLIFTYSLLQMMRVYDVTKYQPPKLTVRYEFYSILRAPNNDSMCIMNEPTSYWSTTYSFVMSVSTWQFDSNVRAAVATRLGKRVPVVYYESQFALYDDAVSNSIAVNPGQYGIRADYVNVGTCYTPSSAATNQFVFWLFVVVSFVGLVCITGEWFRIATHQ